MSDRDELIAKARKLSEAATPGPWTWANWGDPGDPETTLQAERPADERERAIWGPIKQIALVRNEENDLSPGDRAFLVKSRTLLPALADLAESEGRRADEAEAERSKSDGAYEALFKRSSNSINTMRTERDAALAELAALKGQQP
jgi:hypothetical protein